MNYVKTFLVIYLPIIAICALPGIVSSQEVSIVVKHISVIDDRDHGVASEIELKTQDDKVQYFADTDENGQAHPNIPCEKRDRLIAIPRSSQYIGADKTIFCGSDIKIKVTYIPTIPILADEARSASKDQSFGAAALLWTEVAYRARPVDEKLSNLATKKAYDAVGKYFDIKTPYVFDKQQDRHVLSMDAVQALKQYQSNNNIPVTGQLDYMTTQKLAGHPIAGYINEAYKKAK